MFLAKKGDLTFDLFLDVLDAPRGVPSPHEPDPTLKLLRHRDRIVHIKATYPPVSTVSLLGDDLGNGAAAHSSIKRPSLGLLRHP